MEKQLKPSQFSRTKMVTCPECGGGGELATSHSFTCYVCGGKGEMSEYERARLSTLEQEWETYERRVISKKVSSLRDKLRKQFYSKFDKKWPIK